MLLKPNPMSSVEPVNFIDLKVQQKGIRHYIDLAIKRVLDEGDYVMGAAVNRLEQDLADFCGSDHVISCSNGTDALALVLRAKGIGPGDAVFVPTFTFCATAEVVVWMGAVPIFIDSLEDTYNIDPASLLQGIEQAKKLGLTPKAIIPVDLFGQPAEYESIEVIAEDHNLWILADAAQSFGACYKNKKVGTFGLATTTSFYPAKPLGCYGDGGAIFTNDDELAALLKSLRVHGQGTDKYDNVRIGMNGRLDTIQAAILSEKLKVFPAEIKARQEIATFYSEGLKDLVAVPVVIPGATSVWAQYTVTLPQGVDRSLVQKELRDRKIPTVVYYPLGLHQQGAYHKFPTATAGPLPVAQSLAERVLSLPMHGYITSEQTEVIVSAVREVLG